MKRRLSRSKVVSLKKAFENGRSARRLQAVKAVSPVLTRPDILARLTVRLLRLDIEQLQIIELVTAAVQRGGVR